MMNKKIVIVLPHLRTGGGQKVAIDEAIGLQKRGLQVKVLSLFPREENPFTRLAENNHIDITYLKKKNGHSLRTLFEVTLFLLKERPSVVHTHLLALPYTALSSVVLKRVSFYHTIHSVANKEAQNMGGIEKILFKWKLFTPIAISDYCKKSIVDYYHIEENRIPIIYNGVDTRHYSYKKQYCNRSDQVIKIISTGRFEAVKNHIFMIEAFYESAKERDIALYLLGDGELRGQIEETINRLDLKRQVKLIGVVDNVQDYLNDAHIYLMCSTLEGLPLSVLEAFACGLPVIATKAGGTIDIVNDTNGILCDINSKHQIVSALNLLITDRNKRLRLSKGAIETANEFDVDKCVQGYYDLFVKGEYKK